MTPKIDNIITEFGRRIAMQVTFTGTVLDDYDTNMTAEAYMSYINRAMLKLFNDTWTSVGGDKGRFVKMFPELQRHEVATNQTISLASAVSILNTSTLTWVKASPYKDIQAIVGLINVTDSKIVNIHNADMYSKIVSQSTNQFTATTNKQLAIYSNGLLTLFCDSLVTKECMMIYIAQPISPTTGDLLVQNGTEDSPFSEHWNGKIAEIAEKLFKIDTQQTS